MVEICTPIVSLMRMVDSPAPCMGKVYYHCFTVLEFLREFPLTKIKEHLRDELVDVFERR